MSVIRIGSVGIGGISRGVHLPGIAKSPDLQLVAVCDIDPEALRYARETYGVDEAHCFTDYHDLINCPEVDAVDISTPNNVHFEVAMAAVKAGKPYAVEKPVTLDSREADELAKATAEKGVKSMVCFSYRFKSAIRYAKELVDRGALGKLYHVDMQYYQAWGLPTFHTKLEWRFQKALTGSGALGDLGSHALDLVRFVTGKDYKRLISHTGTFITQREKKDGSGLGTVDVDDFSNYMAEMEDGVAATFRITRYAYGRGNYQTMEVYGSEGAIQYELDHVSDTDELFVCVGKPYMETKTFVKVPIPERCRVDQMQSFADIILGKEDGKAAGIADGQINQHAVDAVLKSAETGGWVEL